VPPRRLPTRTCVACRTARHKRELVRVVRRPDGTLVLDPTGRAAGRGAYLCADTACWELAARRGALEHALKVTLPPHLRDTIAAGPSGFAAATTDSPRAAGGPPPTDTHTNPEGGARGQE